MDDQIEQDSASSLLERKEKLASDIINKESELKETALKFENLLKREEVLGSKVGLLERQISVLEMDSEKLKEKCLAQETKLKDLKDEIVSAKSEAEKTELVVTKITREKADLESQVFKLTQEIISSKEEIAQMSSEKSKLDKLKTDLVVLKSDVNVYQGLLARTKDQVEMAKRLAIEHFEGGKRAANSFIEDAKITASRKNSILSSREENITRREKELEEKIKKVSIYKLKFEQESGASYPDLIIE